MNVELVKAKARSRALRATVAGLALSSAAVGCGSGGGISSTCGVVPCGGDVVGTWQATSSCVDHAILNKDFMAGVMGSCPTASIGAVNMTPSGTVTFAADMTFTGGVVVDSTLDVNLPAACIPANATCDMVTQLMQTTVGTNGLTGVNCVGTGSCVCTLALTTDTINGTGTWTTSGTKLTLAGTTGPQNHPYCVEDTSLHILELDMPTMMAVVTDVVLIKQ